MQVSLIETSQLLVSPTSINTKVMRGMVKSNPTIHRPKKEGKVAGRAKPKMKHVECIFKCPCKPDCSCNLDAGIMAFKK